MDRNEFQQVMDDYNQNSPQGGGASTEAELVMIGLYLFLGLMLVFGAATWLDQQFHWHLVSWLQERLHNK